MLGGDEDGKRDDGKGCASESVLAPSEGMGEGALVRGKRSV